MITTTMAIVCLAASTALPVQTAKSHRVVIEVNVSGEMAYQTVLGNAANLKKAFAPEPVEIEVVCEGRGIEMLLMKKGPLGDRVQKTQRAGVVFAVCGNTVRAMHIDRKHLYPFVAIVDAGVAEVVRKQEAGWAYLKGAY